MTDTWLEDRIADLETQLEQERDRRIEAERELERLKSPAAVLTEAERLLYAAGVYVVELLIPGAHNGVYLCDGQETDPLARGATLAEAYEKLKGGRNG